MNGTCPSHRELAALLDGRLPADEARRVREHLLECESCYEVVGEAAAFLIEQDATRRAETPPIPEPRPLPASRPLPDWRIAVAAAALLLVALGGGSWWWLQRQEGGTEARLFALAPTTRPALVRLAEAPYQRPSAVSRGAEGAVDWRLLAEAARAREAAGQKPSGERLRILGLAHLLIGEHREAVRVLRSALAVSAEPAIAIDLGAALIAEGQQEERPDLVAQGLEVLERIEDPAPPAALFNRALALELLGLRSRAQAAWEHYLARDPSSPWANEARARLARLRRDAAAVPAQDSEALERKTLEEILPAWAHARLADREDEARALLVRARSLARGHEAAHGDRLLTDVVADLEGSPEHTKRQAIGLSAYAAARRAYADRDLAGCPQLAGKAIELLVRERNQLAPLAALTAGACAYLSNNLGACDTQLAVARSLAHNFPSSSRIVAGQVDWLAGLSAHAGGRPAAALAHYRAALQAFATSRDGARVAMVHALTADLFEYLGRNDEAWAEAVGAARTAGLEPRRRYASLQVLARLAATADLPHVARETAAAAVAEARLTGDASFVADGLLGVGRASSLAGDPTAASSQFREALAIAERIPEIQLRERSVAFASTELAGSLAIDDPAAALELASRATHLEKEGGDLFVPLAIVRSSIDVRRGRLDRAEAVLRAAVRRSAAERRTFGTLTARDEAFDHRVELHQQLIRVIVERGHPAAALAAMEEWRAEGLAVSGSLASEKPRPNDAGQIATILPLQHAESGAEILAFLALPDELLAWRIRHGSVSLTRIPIRRDALASLVGSAVAEVRGDEPTGGALRRLAAAVLPPRIAGTPLVVVPDPVLFAAPFAALPDRASGQPLLTSREVMLEPSLAAWRRPDPQVEPMSTCPLLVRGAAAGGELYPHLPQLLRLDDEISEVARRYPCARVVRTDDELQAALAQRPQLLHYAGHAVTASGGGGFLLLKGTGVPLPISAQEIERWRLTGTTVVLNACSAADGHPSSTAGRDSLGRAFLAAGARTVIANLWPVTDEASLELATLLHDRLASGSSAASALRGAQLELRAAGRPPAIWAGWIVMGHA